LATPQQSSNKFGFVFGLHNIWFHGAEHSPREIKQSFPA